MSEATEPDGGVDAIPAWSSTEEFSLRYRIPDSTARYWRKIKYGPQGVRVGRKVLYSRDEILKFDRQLQEAVENGDAA